MPAKRQANNRHWLAEPRRGAVTYPPARRDVDDETARRIEAAVWGNPAEVRGNNATNTSFQATAYGRA